MKFTLPPMKESKGRHCINYVYYKCSIFSHKKKVSKKTRKFIFNNKLIALLF
jgi:hypothetical protein